MEELRTDELREYLPPFGEICFVFPSASPKYKIEIHGIIHFLISNFRRALNVVCFLLGNSPASEFYMSICFLLCNSPASEFYMPICFLLGNSPASEFYMGI